MSHPKLRFAILGFGLHAARRLLPAFAASTSTSLVGMWRRDQAAARADCEQHGLSHCFSSREELCASSEIDAVFITSPDAMHRDDALLALGHGKAVLCEKPLAMNTAEALEMDSAANAAGVKFGVAQNFRYNRNLESLRHQISAGAIGRPQFAQAHFNYEATKAPRKWIADPNLACGGPIGDVGVHCIDALRFVLGAEVENVATLASQDSFSGRLEAVASLQMQMTGGIFAHVLVDARSPYRTLLEVTGSEGTLYSESAFTVDRPVEVVRLLGRKVVETRTVDNRDAYTRMLDSFAEAVLGKATFAAPIGDGVRNMLALDAAYKSRRSGRREAAG